MRYVLSDAIGDWLQLRPDPVARALIRTVWPAFIAFREGLNPIAPISFYMLDQFIRAIAMLFLNRGTSPTATLITIPTGNRP